MTLRSRLTNTPSVFLAGENDKRKSNVIRYLVDYDDGDVRKKSFFDTEGNPVLTNDGYASMEMEYNRYGQTRLSYFDANGNPAMYKGLYSHQEISYDDFGRIIKLSQYDQYSNLIIYMVVEYDNTGKIISKKFYDGNGNEL